MGRCVVQTRRPLGVYSLIRSRSPRRQEVAVGERRVAVRRADGGRGLCTHDAGGADLLHDAPLGLMIEDAAVVGVGDRDVAVLEQVGVVGLWR